LLFGLCRSVWIIDSLVTHLRLIPKLQHAPLPLKSYEPGSMPQLLLFSLFSPLDSQLSPSKGLGVCHKVSSQRGIEYIVHNLNHFIMNIITYVSSMLYSNKK
jgi:hypothetical protein